jgi:hypothetical protein
MKMTNETYILEYLARIIDLLEEIRALLREMQQ